jgi:1-deoxy-D-xylulose-5-phosphate reductoisomerase
LYASFKSSAAATADLIGSNLSSTNEVAVQAFLEKKISYTAISKIVRTVLDYNWNEKIENFEDVFEKDRKARQLAMERI